MAEHIILCGYLGICSCYDCRYRRIPLWLLRLGIGIGGLYAAVLLFSGQIAWQAALTGAAPGAVMLLYSRLSQEKKGSKNTKIPFAPFFLAAVLLLGITDIGL